MIIQKSRIQIYT